MKGAWQPGLWPKPHTRNDSLIALDTFLAIMHTYVLFFSCEQQCPDLDADCFVELTSNLMSIGPSGFISGNGQ
jgi:hypothetical protein